MRQFPPSALVVLSAGCLLLAGCVTVAPEAGGDDAPPPSSTAAPEPSATASPSPSAPSVAAPECADLLDEETTARFEALATSDGFVAFPDYAEEIRDSDDPLAAFVRAGGAACLWGAPNTDFVATLGWAPLAGREAEELQDRLRAKGFSEEPTPDGTVYCSLAPEDVSLGYDNCFLFTSEDAYYADYRVQLPMLKQQVATL